MARAYYNEKNSYAAQWLRNLIAAGHIAPGDVDERDIRDVHPDDLRPYTQVHLFAGIGVWSYALRLAEWPDDRPVWSCSCPCQPFSTAGAGLGFTDERHLWPSAHWLVAQRKPATVFGEQVASEGAEPWIDLVSADMEGLGYAVGAVAFPAASVGAPNIRDRAYWVADANYARPQGRRVLQKRADQFAIGALGVVDGERPREVNGFWRDADWLHCNDARWRSTEPGAFPLATGLADRVGRISAYGNALNAQAARHFIASMMECIA